MSAVIPDKSGVRRGRWARVALLSSVVLHGLGGVAATRLAVDAGPDPRGTFARNAAAAPVGLIVDWAPPDAPDPSIPPEADQAEPPPEVVTTEPPPPPQVPAWEPLRLGIETSRQQTDNVMGFDDPTPHAATQSEIDQPALDPMPGAPAAGAPAVKPLGSAEGLATDSTRPDAAGDLVGPPAPPSDQVLAQTRGDGPEDVAARPETVQGASDVPQQPGVGVRPGQAEASPAVPAQVRGEETAVTAKAAEPGGAAPSARGEADGTAPATQATPPQVGAPVDAALGNAPGIKSEKEADPASKQAPIEVVLGRPAAGEGLEIITKRPRRNPFSLVTRVTASPSNPIIEVKFGRSGDVLSARVVRSSGASDVDGPLLAAVYTWTARGKRLQELPSNSPDAAITVSVTILLRY